MRIVSQSGNISIEMENVVLTYEWDSIVAFDGDKQYVMAKYPSESRCNEVFDKLHKLYAERIKTSSESDTGDIFYMPRV